MARYQLIHNIECVKKKWDLFFLESAIANLDDNIGSTVKFIIVAASPIKAAPNFQFFFKNWQKFPNLRTFYGSNRATFQICQGPMTKENNQVLSKKCG